MNPVIQAAFDSWTPPVVNIATLIVTAAIYARGFSRLHRQMPDRFPMWRLATFMAGIAALFIAVASPLEELDDLLLQIHMTQHLLLMLVAPSLLLAGAPAIALVARTSSAYRQSNRRTDSPIRCRAPTLRMADAAAGVLDCIRRRDLGMASAGDVSARAPLRRMARGRARMLFHDRADVLVPGHPAMAERRAMAAMGDASLSPAGRRAEHDSRRALHVFRSR